MLSGCCASASAAPGTTTEGPWSPPMASSAMRTFWGMDRPEHRRWDAGNSVFGSDRVKIDNSLPAGGHTSGYRFAGFGAFATQSSAVFWSYRPSSGPPAPRTGGSPDRRPAARRTRRRACADRDRFPEAEIRWPSRRDRPCHSAASPADRPPRPLAAPPASGAAAASGRNTRSIASSISAFDRLQRHDAVLHDGRLDPSDNPQPVGAVPRQIEASLEPRQRREVRGFGDRRPRAVVRRRYRYAARFPGCPQPRPGTLQGGSADAFACAHRHAIVSGSGNSSFARASAPGSCSSSRRLASRI